MPRLRRTLPFAVLSLVFSMAHAHEHDHDHTEHGSLGKHEHGVAALNVALEGKALEIALDSPAMNLVGFEHAASTDADKQKVAQVQQQLRQPAKLFGLPDAAGCTSDKANLSSPLFGSSEAEHDHDDEHEHEHEHSDVEAEYSFTCEDPAALEAVDLSGFFKQFPATQKINVQSITPNGQKGDTLTVQQPKLTF